MYLGNFLFYLENRSFVFLVLHKILGEITHLWVIIHSYENTLLNFANSFLMPLIEPRCFRTYTKDEMVV